MPKIETSLLTEQAYNILREKIIVREYRPGSKLDIHKLADEFGVSRSPIKDAINQLVHEGLIEIVPRKGTYVTQLKLDDFIEILDARLMIEMWSAKEVIQNISEEEIEKWGKIVQDMDALLEATPFSFEQYSKLDTEFHETLIKWTNNKKIKDMFSSLNTHVALSRIVYNTPLESTIKRHKDHLHMYEAMKNKDFQTLSDTLILHIGSLKKEAETQWDEMTTE